MTGVFIRRGNLDTETYNGRTQGEDSHWPAKDEGLKLLLPSQPSLRNPVRSTLDLRLLVSRIMKKCLLVKHPHSVALGYKSPRKVIQAPRWRVYIKYVVYDHQKIFYRSVKSPEPPSLTPPSHTLLSLKVLRTSRRSKLLEFTCLPSLHCKIKCKYLRSLTLRWDFFLYFLNLHY